MEITFDQNLIDYMQKKGYAAIRIETTEPVGSCTDTSDLVIGFVQEKDMEKVRAKTLRTLTGGPYPILILKRGIEVEQQVRLTLKSFLGLKDVRADGIHAWRI